jgi:uncharacterized radical SAM superfamily Fe-S cluster-containing enzyme
MPDDFWPIVTESVCPDCLRPVEAQLIERAGQVIMQKTCPDHGLFEALTFSDAELYRKILPYNKPGQRPLEYTTPVKDGCPWDCGLCPEHRQHLCLGLIEITSRCNLECPVCFANGSPANDSFELTYEQVNFILDRLVATEGKPEVVQFSGGEPTLHPQLLDFVALAKQKGITYVMVNTNGLRIATDDAFLAALAEHKPHIYLQFDGFDPTTSLTLRGRADLLDIKLRALDRLAAADVRVVLVAVIERGVNEHEIGRIVEFAIQHPAVFGISFQVAFHAQRYAHGDPLQRLTLPDILKAVETQTNGLFTVPDFIPIPCCAPTCGFATYALLGREQVTPIPRLLPVDIYLDYVQNRSLPSLDADLLRLLEGLWSSSAQVGADRTSEMIFQALGGSPAPGQPDWSGGRCESCRVGLPFSMHQPRDLGRHIFMISVRDFMDRWTFDTRDIHKCCIGVLLPDGRTIPFCAYNSVGYRETPSNSPHRKTTDEGRARVG